jgi:hypothetical protein
MSDDPDPIGDGSDYRRRTFMALLSAFGITGAAGCSGDDGGGTDTEGGNGNGDTPTDTTSGNGNGNGNGDTATEPPTQTPPPTAPPVQGFDPVTYPRPDDANVVFGEGVDGLNGLTATPPDPNAEEQDYTEVTQWELADDGSYFTVINGTGNKWFRDLLGDVHLHIEFSPPDNAGDASGQSSGNSGIFLMDRYEVQVINNWNNTTFGAGYAGSLYQDCPPLVDPAHPPTEWNAYDIIWRAPEFDDQGSVESPAAATIFMNGVCIMAHINARGPNFGGPSPYEQHAKEISVRLQDHPGISDVSYRNIWYQVIPPHSETGDDPQYRQQYEYDKFDDVSSIDDYMCQDYLQDLPDSYRANEGNRYGPPVVDSGADLADPPNDGQFSTAPGDATILLEAGDLEGWVGPDGGEPGWTPEGDHITVAPGAGNITSEETVGDSQIHVEFRIPEGASNPDSGVLLADRYEINIAGSGTGVEGCGAYTYQAAPLRDATRPAGEWQSLDMVWQGPRTEGGVFGRPGRVTVLLNGQVVQKRLYLNGSNADGQVDGYGAHPASAPITLQENGSEVDFRYLWARPLYPDKQRQ